MKSWVSYLLNVTRIRHHSNFNSAFTIVELLVVIVVIGVLAAITVVSYTGITNKASMASLQSDLASASTQLKMFQTVNGGYPTTISTDCVSTPTSTTAPTNLCLKLSPGNTIATTPFSGYVSNNTTSPQTFSLTMSNNSVSGIVTDNSKPSLLTPAPLNPVADWIATPTGDHYGNYYDSVTKTWATVTRTTPKTIYDPATQRIYDVPAGKLAVNPRSDGKNGFEAVIEEGRTNYVLQSSFENIMSGWNYQYVANGSVASSSEKSVYGSYSLKINRTAGTSEANVYYSMSGLTPSTTYTYSAYVWSSQANSACIFTALGSTNLASVCHSGNSTWQRISGTFVSSISGTIQLRLGTISGGPIGSTYYDAAQVELGTFNTSYIPTTAATVTRNADVVKVPTVGWNTNSGTIVAVAGVHPSDLVIHGLVNWRTDSSNRLYLYKNAAIGATIAYGVTSGSPLNSYSGSGYVPAVSAMTYQAAGLTAYYNGLGGTQSAAITIPSLPSTAIIGSGGDTGTIEFFNGPIQRFIVYSSALSGTDVLTVTNAIKDGP